MSSTDVSDVVNTTNVVNTESVTTKKRVGRPPKQAIAAAKKKNKVGRPAGEAAIMNEMKARLIASPKSKKVLDSIMNAALDDEHKNQAAAWRLIMDRMLPISLFEKDKNGGARPSVNITISGVGSPVEISGDTYEGEQDEDV
jgi:hypothetical protein